jgi:CRP-like cAMP-binding protein
MDLKESLLKRVHFSDKELQEMINSFTEENIDKDQIILQSGQICNKLYYVKSGIIRSYYINENGKEITQWFFNDGKFMTSIESFYQQKPSIYTLKALEKTKVFSITKSKLDLLFDKSPKAERFGRLLAVEMLIKVANKLNAIQFQKAKERYDYMINEFPNIYYKVPLGHIASYLGMTQETLSRIRKN